MSEKQAYHNIIDGDAQASSAMAHVLDRSNGEVHALAPNRPEG